MSKLSAEDSKLMSKNAYDFFQSILDPFGLVLHKRNPKRQLLIKYQNRYRDAYYKIYMDPKYGKKFLDDNGFKPPALQLEVAGPEKSLLPTSAGPLEELIPILVPPNLNNNPSSDAQIMNEVNHLMDETQRLNTTVSQRNEEIKEEKDGFIDIPLDNIPTTQELNEIIYTKNSPTNEKKPKIGERNSRNQVRVDSKIFTNFLDSLVGKRKGDFVSKLDSLDYKFAKDFRELVRKGYLGENSYTNQNRLLQIFNEFGTSFNRRGLNTKSLINEIKQMDEEKRIKMMIRVANAIQMSVGQQIYNLVPLRSRLYDIENQADEEEEEKHPVSETTDEIRDVKDYLQQIQMSPCTLR